MTPSRWFTRTSAPAMGISAVRTSTLTESVTTGAAAVFTDAEAGDEGAVGEAAQPGSVKTQSAAIVHPIADENHVGRQHIGTWGTCASSLPPVTQLGCIVIVVRV